MPEVDTGEASSNATSAEVPEKLLSLGTQVEESEGDKAIPVSVEDDVASETRDAGKQKVVARDVGEQTNIQAHLALFVKQAFRRRSGKGGKRDTVEEPKAPQLSFEDPTEPLLAGDTPEAEIEEREELLAEWSTQRILLLSSFQPEPALVVAYSLMHDLGFREYEKRTLLLNKSKHRERSDLTIEIFTRPELLARSRQIVLVDIERTSPFLDSILQIGLNHARGVKELLRQRDSLLICTASTTVLKIKDDQRLLKGFRFGHHPVPYLPYLLRQSFPAPRAGDLHDILLAQHRRGCWGSLTELYEQVEGYLSEGPNRLEEIVLQNDAIRNSSPERTQAVKPTDVFREDSRIHSAVLYTATYFRELTPHDFESLVLLLLDGQTLYEEAEEHVLTEQGEVRTLKKRVEKRLVDMWRENPDRFLRECHLRATPLRHGPHVMEFSLPYLRRELKNHLEANLPMFLVRMDERIQAAGLLFNPTASSDIIDNLIQLFVDRTLTDPSFCGKDWLFRLMIGLQAQTSVKIAPEASADERIFLLLAGLEGERIRRHFLSRLAQLIREMLQHDALQELVREFLGTLLAAHQHDAALSLLLELTRRLRFAPQFDPLLWFRRLIDQGSPEIRLRTFQCLVGLAFESGPRVFELIEALHSWLPADLDIDSYSLSSRSALSILLEYSVDTLAAFDTKYFGQWPSRFPMFAMSPEDESLLRSRMDLLCEWLLHPGMTHILEMHESEALGLDIDWKDWFDGPEEAHGALVAELVEQWVLILEGVNEKPPQADARRVGDELLAALGRRATRAQRNRIIRRWQARQQQCHIDVNQLPVEEREERARLLANRKKLVEIRQRFLRSS